MSEEQLKEAKNFRFQMGFCAAFCWIATIILSFTELEKFDGWCIIPIGGAILTVIHFNMNNLITKYENLNKK